MKRDRHVRAERQKAAAEGDLRVSIAAEVERVLGMRRQLIAEGARAREITVEVRLRVTPWERCRLTDLANGIHHRPKQWARPRKPRKSRDESTKDKEA